MTSLPSPKDAARLLYHLRRSQARHKKVAGTGLSPQMAMLRAWQSERLARTHADLIASPRYGPACRFFLSDLYAPRDFSQRDHDMLRVYNFMRKFLPAAVLHPLALAVELQILTTDLDEALLEALFHRLGVTGAITPALYAEAYRLCDNYDERVRQIDLVVDIGRQLEGLVRFPLTRFTVRMARRPALQAGWSELQDFLERGLDAFHKMGRAEEFLHIIQKREMRILDRIFAGAPNPFEIDD